jgi:hypothetical protein
MCDREAEDHRSGHDHVAWGEILSRGFAERRGVTAVAAFAELLGVHVIDVQYRASRTPAASAYSCALRRAAAFRASARKAGLSMTSKLMAWISFAPAATTSTRSC